MTATRPQQSANADDATLLHRRLAHANARYISFTMHSGHHHVHDCTACRLAKATRNPHPPSVSRSLRPGHGTHADWLGPISPPSLGGAKMVLLLTDDFCRFMTVFVCTNKSDAPRHIMSYFAHMLTQQRHVPAWFKSDNGPELCTTELQEYFRNLGMLHHKSTPYVPQQNGRAERANRTLIEATSVLMVQANAPPSLWAEAVSAATHILNTIARDNTSCSPRASFTGTQDTDLLTHLRVWGCQAFAITSDKDFKFGARAELLVLVGFEGAHAYRVYNPSNSKIYVRSDVTFLEDVFPFKTVRVRVRGTIQF